MGKIPSDLLKEYVSSQKFESTADIMSAMKGMFADVLQQAMSCELDEHLGYEKSERVSNHDGLQIAPKNYRNGFSRKTVKTQLGETEFCFGRCRN